MTDVSSPLPSTNGKHPNPSTHPPSYDLGNLLVTDPSPMLSSELSEPHLHSRAQYCAQSLISQLLTTCPIHVSSAAERTVLMTLPPPTTPIPREKPLPKPKEKTTWERFAEKKGIKKDGRRDNEGNKVYDEEKGEWVPKWGYKGKNKGTEGDWIVEVDEKKEADLGREGKTVRGEGRRERKEKAKRQDRKERANEKKGRRGNAG
ncbi:uncharacterized protein KY384_008995 [Bacidia gigantensis]|uniref:uncharacterized protein n=1 Tax=Bacidia gigantensis TaxID=2732470 RepID=UPI001D041C20|nr:uncharacterized protein KY384_008995 [Bacidia gigantensis]KAG8525351.1 hypothetical protein KY384_008995 [Bacidia gigantensis]